MEEKKYRKLYTIKGLNSIDLQVNPEQMEGICYDCHLEMGEDWRESVSPDGRCRCDDCHAEWEAR